MGREIAAGEGTGGGGGGGGGGKVVSRECKGGGPAAMGPPATPLREEAVAMIV